MKTQRLPRIAVYLVSMFLGSGILDGRAATYYQESFSSGFAADGVIPDGSLTGWSDSRTVTGSGIHHVGAIEVSLSLSGGYNGDLYAYLVHDTGLAVLLNRVGVGSSDSFGYDQPGLDVTFSSTASHDVHFYATHSPAFDGDGRLTGTWKPDGRGVDPLADAADFDAAGTSDFRVFENQEPDGLWTLFVADVSAGGGTNTVVSWSLRIDTVVEPPTNLVVTGVAPGTSVVAGTPFEVTIEARNVNGLAADVSQDTPLALTLNTGNGTLGGTLTATLIQGTSTVTFTNVTYSLAESGVVLAVARTTGDDLVAANSSAFDVSPGAFAALQLLMPGESAAPGSVSGKTGTPSNRAVGVSFDVTLRAVDAHWNPISTNDTVAITSTDTTATLPADASLVGGTATFAVTFYDAGSHTVTASDVTHADIADGVGSATTVDAGDQSITFGALADATYGDAPVSLSATASSALAVAFSVTSGPATVSGTTLTLTGAGSVTVEASQSGNANWNAATSVSRTFAVAAKTVTPHITAQDKTYDGTTSATVERTLAGTVSGDDVGVAGGTPTFADADVGTNKTVTVTGLTLTGNDAGNYVLSGTTAMTTADITSAGVTVTSGLTAISKAYDGTTTATLNSNAVALAGIAAADLGSVSLSTNGYTADFDTAIVGTGKSVTVSGLSLVGDAASNYALTQPVLSADITAGEITVASGLAALAKIYDGTTTAALSSNNVVLAGIVAADVGNVDLSTNGYAADFDTASVGVGKPVSVSGLTLTGTAASNYTLTAPILAADISAAEVTVASGLSALSKIYDGTVAATLSSNAVVLSGVVAADLANVALSTNGYTASFETAAVGTGKTVTVGGLGLSGTAASNYDLAQPEFTADIEAGPVAQLAFVVQPDGAGAGSAFAQQPVIRTQDAYGNDSVAGLDAHLTVTVTLGSGTGTLLGTVSLDIGTTGGNGTVSFADLRIDAAGYKQLTASATGLDGVDSDPFAVPNASPSAALLAVTRPRNVTLKIRIADLLANATDANGDSLVLAGVSTSTNGAAIRTNATHVLYTVPPGGNVADGFQYTVSDGTATSSGWVLVAIEPDPAGLGANLVSYTVVAGHPTIAFAGIPGYVYRIQRATSLVGTPTWTDLAVTNAPPGGLFEYVDAAAPEGNSFYRAINQ